MGVKNNTLRIKINFPLIPLLSSRDSSSTRQAPKMMLHKQKGVVLIVALVFLVALTGVAAALMQNTTSDMKMTGASNEKVIATQAAISAIDEVLNNQLNVQAVNLFKQELNNIPNLNNAQLLPAATVSGATAQTSVINNRLFVKRPCPRGSGFSVGFECHHFQLQVTRPYGRNNTSTVVVTANIAQLFQINN